MKIGPKKTVYGADDGHFTSKEFLMSKAAMNLQDSFLNQVRRENSEVRVLLVNGTLLRGTVKGFDNFTLILNNRNGQHLIYKHAVAQIVTHRPYNKNDEFPSVEADDSSASESEKTEEAEAEVKTASSPAHSQGPSHTKREGSSGEQQDRRQKPKKEGFNKLDLSHLKLGETEKR